MEVVVLGVADEREESDQMGECYDKISPQFQHCPKDLVRTCSRFVAALEVLVLVPREETARLLCWSWTTWKLLVERDDLLHANSI